MEEYNKYHNCDIGISFYSDKEWFDFEFAINPSVNQEEWKFKKLVQSSNYLINTRPTIYNNANSLIFNGNIKIRRDIFYYLIYHRMYNKPFPKIYRWRNNKLKEIDNKIIERVCKDFYPQTHTTSYITY